MLKKLLFITLSLILTWTSVIFPVHADPLNQGKYPVQQAMYNDADGGYTLLLLNTPRGKSPTLETTDLQMVRLTDEEMKAGEKTYLAFQDNHPVLHLNEDFKIEYVHNVTETQNTNNGQPQTVIVRRESSFWTPFAGAIAGQVVANMLFTPHYYIPPVYSHGVVLTGYGSYGTSYSQAVQNYQTRYQQPPAAEVNRQTFRTAGNLRNQGTNTARNTLTKNNTRATGSGFGTNTLKSSGNRNTARVNRPSFGSGFGSRSFSRGFGRRR